jgi:drug/metabolite transporter (DMT)-like permease
MNALRREKDTSALRADAVLIAVTAVWGTSFVVTRHALDSAPPFLLVACRFGLGTILLAPALVRRRWTPGIARDGAILGGLAALSMSLQVSGQALTTATNAGFLIGLASVFTPFVAVARTRRLPTVGNAAGISLASAGFLLLTFPPAGSTFQRGDLLVAASSVVLAVEAVELAERAARHDTLWLTALQLAIVAAWTGLLSAVVRSPLFAGTVAGMLERRPVVGESFAVSVAYLGTVCTAAAFFGWTWAQGRMSAIHGAILLTLEPLVASVLAAWLLRERLGSRGIAGAVFVLAGIVVSEIRLSKKDEGPGTRD